MSRSKDPIGALPGGVTRAWRADRGQIEGTLLWRDREAIDRLVAAVDVADGGELPRARVVE